MMAGEKVTVSEILDAICEDIRRRLMKNDSLSNDSLCYSGARYVFAIQADFSSRAETHMDTGASGTVGEMPPGDVVVGVEATGSGSLSKKSTWKSGTLKKAQEAKDGHIA